MNQGVLPLSEPRWNYRATDPDTSKAAAVLPRPTLTAAVRACLEDHPAGLTDYELLTLLHLPERRRGSVVKRRQDAGCVDTGLRRANDEGRLMVVWRLAR